MSFSEKPAPTFRGHVLANGRALLEAFMGSKLLATALLCGLLAPGLTGCGSVGPLVGDALPQWAGGLPKDIPPRPGTPEYEEYRRRLLEPKVASPPEQEQGQEQQAQPAASAPAPRSNSKR
jgi:hypothetical protein